MYNRRLVAQPPEPSGLGVSVKTGRPRGRGSRAVDLGSMVTETRETMIYPGSGPLDGGKTLRPALVYINGDVSST